LSHIFPDTAHDLGFNEQQAPHLMLLLQHKGGIFSSENMQSDKKIKRNFFPFEKFSEIKS